MFAIKYFLPYILNFFAPYSGAFLTGSIKRIYSLPIIILYLLLFFQREDVIYGYVLVKNIGFITGFIIICMFIHSCIILKNRNKYMNEYLVAIIMVVISAIGDYYYLYGSGSHFLAASRITPFSYGNVLITSGEDYEVGDLVIAKGELGNIWFGILLSTPENNNFSVRENEVFLCNNEDKCRNVEAYCIEISQYIDIEELERSKYKLAINRKIVNEIDYSNNITIIKKIIRYFRAEEIVEFPIEIENSCSFYE